MKHKYVTQLLLEDDTQRFEGHEIDNDLFSWRDLEIFKKKTDKTIQKIKCMSIKSFRNGSGVCFRCGQIIKFSSFETTLYHSNGCKLKGEMKGEINKEDIL